MLFEIFSSGWSQIQVSDDFLSQDQLTTLFENPRKVSEVITRWPCGDVMNEAHAELMDFFNSNEHKNLLKIGVRLKHWESAARMFHIRIYKNPWYERLVPQFEEIGFRKCSDGYYRKDDDNECAFFFQLTRPEPGVSGGEVIIKVTKSETEDNVTELIDTHLQIKDLGMEYDIPQRVVDLFETIGY